ncbi:hypothetical protein HN748_00820 [Candidatus Peregrinibacteria bacterium]|jgi:hypothetical protein|nr:hypothetical protein [Candidatus Peregrinibacteria bacterium]MBT7484363.1 hypothetical protein [Candidatus Peregrinibacteria bacterium]MBT7702753.1 hypothetical protein [Candidatus Peregrinibacteria bacterium]
MGSGREKRAYQEIDETRQSAADDRFEEILQKVKDAGAEIKRDEYEPMYSAMGEDNYDIGEKRIVEFNLASFDFIITREVQDAKVEGHGHQAKILELDMPQVEMKLRRKPQYTEEWEIVDLDDFM